MEEKRLTWTEMVIQASSSFAYDYDHKGNTGKVVVLWAIGQAGLRKSGKSIFSDYDLQLKKPVSLFEVWETLFKNRWRFTPYQMSENYPIRRIKSALEEEELYHFIKVNYTGQKSQDFTFILNEEKWCDYTSRGIAREFFNQAKKLIKIEDEPASEPERKLTKAEIQREMDKLRKTLEGKMKTD